jgi:hypothetical protein
MKTIDPTDELHSDPRSIGGIQENLFEDDSPAAKWSEDAAKHALDELFTATFVYRQSKAYLELMNFIRGFRFYSRYNALLVHLQRPGAKFVAPPTRWKREFRRSVKPSATPIVILQPMGPVMFVFDVIDTEAGPDSRPLPPGVDKPFEPRSGGIGRELQMTIENAKRDGIRILAQKTDSQAAGSIQWAEPGLPPVQFPIGRDKEGNQLYEEIALRYELLLNSDLSRTAQYVTIAHELGHLYCGHLGTNNKNFWPDRRGLPQDAVEFEAESVAYLLCGRRGIAYPSEQYLVGYVAKRDEVPRISLECVMKAAGLIETMGLERMKPRRIGKRP